MAEENSDDCLKEKEPLQNNLIFPNGYRFNAFKTDVGEFKESSKNVKRRQISSVGSSLNSDSDNESDSNSNSFDRTEFHSDVDEISNKFCSVSLTVNQSTLSSKSKIGDGFVEALKKAVFHRRQRRSSYSSDSDEQFSEDDDDDDDEKTYNVISRGPQTPGVVLSKVRKTSAPFDSALSLHRRIQNQNNSCNITLDALYENYDRSVIRSQEIDKLLDELSNEQVDTLYGIENDEWYDLETMISNTKTENDELNPSFVYEYFPVSPSNDSGDDYSAILNDNLNYSPSSAVLGTSPESEISSDGDRSSRYRANRLSVDSFTSDDCKVSRPCNSLSPYESFTDSSNCSTFDGRSLSPSNSMSPCSSTLYENSIFGFSGIGPDGGMQSGLPKVSADINSDITSTHLINESTLTTANKFMAGGIMYTNPVGHDDNQILNGRSSENGMSPTLKSLGSPKSSVFKDMTNYSNPLLNNSLHDFSKRPANITTCVTTNKKEVVNMPPQVNSTNSQIPVAISDSMKERDNLEDVLRFVKSNEILYRIQYCLMLVKIRRLEKISKEETDKVLFNYLFELSSVFGYDEMKNLSAKEADQLKVLWEFQLVALIQCILQYLKRPEIFTTAQYSKDGSYLFTPLQVAAVFNFKVPLVARCIADCIVQFTAQNPDQKMLFSLAGEAKPSLLYMLHQIGPSHAAVVAQLEKVKKKDKTTPAFSLHIEKTDDSVTTTTDPLITDDTLVQIENSIGRADLLSIAMYDAKICYNSL